MGGIEERGHERGSREESKGRSDVIIVSPLNKSKKPTVLLFKKFQKNVKAE